MSCLNQKIIVFVVILVLILGVGGYLITQNNKSNNTTTKTETTNTTPQETSVGENIASPNNATQVSTPGIIKEFTVNGSAFKFDLSEIKVKKGDTVKITYKNAGGMHDFVLDEFNVKTKVLSTGAQETVQFVADKSGQFEYYCSVGNHRAQGMKGMLIVE